MAEKIGIDIRTYQKYESDSTASPQNRSVPSFERIQNICNILKCDMEYLAGEGQEDDFEKSTKIPAEYLKKLMEEKTKNTCIFLSNMI